MVVAWGFYVFPSWVCSAAVRVVIGGSMLGLGRVVVVYFVGGSVCGVVRLR